MCIRDSQQRMIEQQHHQQDEPEEEEKQRAHGGEVLAMKGDERTAVMEGDARRRAHMALQWQEERSDQIARTARTAATVERATSKLSATSRALSQKYGG
eukprot:TRINITY_DN20704_c0_g1_i1.p2 TRINITY_DN20704_c0_g1~~TRINITY_DN20704_c0_g1_i1.p2  ORF type:complete len:112 (-),score=27.38 TRINITY_DN20704_c0_g1_i1:88-384(-)